MTAMVQYAEASIFATNVSVRTIISEIPIFESQASPFPSNLLMRSIPGRFSRTITSNNDDEWVLSAEHEEYLLYEQVSMKTAYKLQRLVGISHAIGTSPFESSNYAQVQK